MRSLFVAIQDHLTRSWFPVAQVEKGDGFFRLFYTMGAKKVSGFSGFGRMRELDLEYFSEDLFPLISNRSLSGNRPEHKRYADWLGLADSYDVFDELSRTGGLRATDDIELIPCPGPNKNHKFEIHFFIRGLRHMSKQAGSSLNENDGLFLMLDVQNRHDQNAVLLRSENPPSLVGYVPRYYASDLHQILKETNASNIDIKVRKVNSDAPAPYRFLCELLAPWPPGFRPCSSEDFQIYR